MGAVLLSGWAPFTLPVSCGKMQLPSCKHRRMSGRLKPPAPHLHILLWHWSPHVCPVCPLWLGLCWAAEPSAWLWAGRLNLQKQTVSSRAL